MANEFLHNSTKIAVGDLVTVYQTIKEKDKERVQTFDGRVIAVKGRIPNQMFTVRKLASNKVGVERIFPVGSPTITKIEVKKSLPAHRAKLYYLRTQKQ